MQFGKSKHILDSNILPEDTTSHSEGARPIQMPEIRCRIV